MKSCWRLALFLSTGLAVIGCDAGTSGAGGEDLPVMHNQPIIGPILPEEVTSFGEPAKLHDLTSNPANRYTLSFDSSTLSVFPYAAESYAVNDDWAAVSRDGQVNMYRRNADGNWTVGTFLNAPNSDTEFNQSYGSSVAMDGDQLVVGASRADGSSGTLTGAVYAYENVGGYWQNEVKLQSSGYSSLLGSKVDIDGDTIVASGANESPAVVFQRSGGGWQEVALLQPLTESGAIANIQSSAIEGDTIVLSALMDPTRFDNGDFINNYALFIYERNTTTWSLSDQISVNGASEVIISGTSIAVESLGEFQGDGEIIVFNKNGETWNQVSTIPGERLIGFDEDTLGVFTLESTTEPFLQFSTLEQIYRRDGNNWVEVLTSRDDDLSFGVGQTDGQFVVFQRTPRQGFIYDFRNVSAGGGGSGGDSGDSGGNGDGSDGSTSSGGVFLGVQQWNGGYIATFECTLEGDPSELLIDFNHTGSGNTELAWMLSYIGDIEVGDIAPNGGFAIRKASVNPVLSAGQTISFQVLVRDGIYDNSDFNVRCITGENNGDDGNGGGSAVNPATLIDSIEWPGGYIATFECTLPNSDINDIVIDFNYTGAGFIQNSWMLTWIGDIENGFLADDGGYVLRTTRVNPYLIPSQNVSFQILVRNDPLSGNQYGVDCLVN